MSHPGVTTDLDGSARQPEITPLSLADTWQHPLPVPALTVTEITMAEAASPSKLGGLSVTELGKRVYREFNKDRILGHSAELAYYFMLALFPALLFLTALL